MKLKQATQSARALPPLPPGQSSHLSRAGLSGSDLEQNLLLTWGSHYLLLSAQLFPELAKMTDLPEQ